MKTIRKRMAAIFVITTMITSICGETAFADYPSGQGYENGKMYNNLVEYVVNNQGRFTIGTTYGNLTNPNDDFKKLLYGHPTPGTSFTTIKVDGTDNYFEAQSVNPDATKLSTKANQVISGVNVEQELSIVPNSNTAKEDTIEIKYNVKNKDTVPHKVGTRIMMDTMLGDNDAAPFRIPGYGAVTTELELTGDNIPEYWMAFDSLTNPSVIGQGTLLRTDNRPDKVQFTNWGRASETKWDLTVNPQSQNGDSAVSIFWNPTELQPGQSKTFVTYYGLSEFIQDLTPPIGLTLNRVSSIEATADGYHPNPIKISGFLNNLGSANAQNVKVKINLNNGLRVANGTNEISIGSLEVGQTKDFYWDVILPEFQTETTLTYSVEAMADNAENKVLSNTFTVPATKVANNALKYYEGAKYSIGAYNILTGASAAISDPVDAATGNFIQSNTDIQINGYNPIGFTRFYNSVDNWTGSLGKNWHNNYEIKLSRISDEKISIRFDDGHVEEYTKASNGVFKPMPGKYGSVNFTNDQGYTLTQKDKTVYTFDLSGALTSIKDISGNVESLTYEAGKLTSVKNDCGSLQFEYTDNFLSKITDSSGRIVQYGYTAGNLTSFKDVDGNSTNFVYDDKDRLTVIIDPTGNAKVTNVYDNKNRVLKQTMADATVNSMSYDEVNKTTTLTQRNGAKIIYKWDDNFRIYETDYVNGTEKAVFDNQSQKTSYTDKNGNTYHYEYDSNGNVTKETDPLGRVIEYTFDSNNQVTSIKDADGSVTSYSYDDKGNLTGAKDPLNRELKVEYNEKSLPTKMTLPDGSSSTLGYNAKSNVISATDPVGNTTKYEYDSQNRVTQIIQPKGNKISFEYTPSGKIKKVTNPDGTTNETIYDSRGLITEEKDASGNVTKNKYDSIGHLIQKTDSAGNVTKYELDSMWNISKVTSPNGAQIKYHYNAANLLDKLIDPVNNSETFEYDSNGNVLKKTDFEGKQTTYAYDALNRLTQVTDAKNNSMKYEYGVNGQIKKVIDAMKQATQYEYDAADQLVKVTDVMGNSTHYSYNKLGYVDSVTDAKGNKTKYQYNSLGKVIKITNPDKSQATFEYDQNGNLSKQIDAKGKTTTYTYDEMDRVTTITNALGSKKSIKYTPTSKVSEVVDENGNKTQYKYDTLNRLIEVVDAKGNSTKYEYDALGNLVKTQRPGGVDSDVQDNMKKNTKTTDYKAQTVDMINKYEYDLRGLLSKEIDPSGKVDTYEYDKNGKLINKTDRDNLKTQFKYDEVGNVQKVIYNDGKQISYEYNPLGQLTKLTDWLGTSSFDLDALGRIKKVNDYRNKTVEYTWSTTGEKLSMKYPDGSLVKYDYDSMGRLTTVTDGDKAETTYKYDTLGNVTEKLLTNGIKTEYSYDALSRLVSMDSKDNKGKSLDSYSYSYDAAGNKTSVNRKSYGEKALINSLVSPQGKTQYKYDALNQLVEVDRPNMSSTKYYYDKLGNRIRKDSILNNKVLTSENYNYDVAGRLSEISGNSPVFDYNKNNGIQNTIKMQYDNRGNLTKTSFGDKVIAQYTFNAENKLEKVINWKNDQTTFNYDGFDRRISEGIQKSTLKNSEISKYFDGLKEKLKDDVGSSLSNYLTEDETDEASKNFTMDITSPYNNLIGIEDNSKNSKFVYGLDVISVTEQPISNQNSNKQSKCKDSSEKNYYLQDELGSPIKLVDGKGKITENYSYDEFGNSISLKLSQGLNKCSNPFGFTGYQYDKSSGLYFAQARYYNAGVGRFVSEDGYKGITNQPQSLNYYVYCNSNPLIYVDPSGFDKALEDYFKHKKFSSPTITILVDQPNPGSREVLGDGVGHSFIRLDMGDGKVFYRGFYPGKEDASAFLHGKNMPGKVNCEDNEREHGWDVGRVYEINKDTAKKVLDFINGYKDSYNLYSNNCTDFAVEALDKAKVVSPIKEHIWQKSDWVRILLVSARYNFNGLEKIKGYSPADAGEDLRESGTYIKFGNGKIYGMYIVYEYQKKILIDESISNLACLTAK